MVSLEPESITNVFTAPGFVTMAPKHDPIMKSNNKEWDSIILNIITVVCGEVE